ncbi:MAG: biotin synthase BioB [Gemmatimonadales bacterium]
MSWHQLADRVLDGSEASADDALAILSSSDGELEDLLQAAFRLRERYFGREVRIHVLRNAKSGLCPEDCAFCSQSVTNASPVERYKLQTVDSLVAGAREAYRRGAVKYCMVTSTRGPAERELDTICEATRQIKAELNIKVCASLGLLEQHQADRLAAAGVDRFNHNLESSRRFYPEICSTHDFEDRVTTVKRARQAGMEACCGGIMGMGETANDRVALALELRALEVESIPVNFLNPRPGTPLADVDRLAPEDCLRALAMMRFVNPTRDIRVAGGREVNLRDQQHRALLPANSMFIDGYLTTPGAGWEADLQMIQAAGFTVAALSVT